MTEAEAKLILGARKRKHLMKFSGIGKSEPWKSVWKRWGSSN